MRKTISLPLGEPKPTPQERLREVGLTMAGAGDQLTITNVGFGSYAKRTGLEAGGIKLTACSSPLRGGRRRFGCTYPALTLADLIWWI